MEEDKKSTAVQPEEAPKPKPRRRIRADRKKACRVPQEAAGQKKHKDNKNNKNRKAQDAEGC